MRKRKLGTDVPQYERFKPADESEAAFERGLSRIVRAQVDAVRLIDVASKGGKAVRLRGKLRLGKAKKPPAIPR